MAVAAMRFLATADTMVSLPVVCLGTVIVGIFPAEH